MESLPHCQLASEAEQQDVRNAYLPMLCASLALSWVLWSVVVTTGLTLHAATSILGPFKSKKLENYRKLQKKQKSLVILPPIMNYFAFLWIFFQSLFWGICFYLIDVLLVFSFAFYFFSNLFHEYPSTAFKKKLLSSYMWL